jgi:hypothetical protein
MNRLLKAKLDVAEQELETIVEERQSKETELAVALEKVKILMEDQAHDNRQITTLTVSLIFCTQMTKNF